MHRSFILWVKQQWDIEIDCVRHDISIPGSPERTVSRGVVQDGQGRLFLVEKLDNLNVSIRERITRAVEYLSLHGLTQALTYVRSVHGDFLPIFNSNCFQLSRFIEGSPLQRPDYLSSAAMGKNTAQFLTKMAQAATGMETHLSFPRFSIKTYIHALFRTMKIHDRPVHDRFLPVLDFLESEFMPAHDSLPLCFCHGDLHPLNIIWNKEEILAVIDWEFAGIKPDLYDAANFVGCAGIENPNGLGMDMVMTFLAKLHQTDVISEMGWRFFPEYVLALRFAWLSEWLRKKDHEMIDLEYAFMRILVDHMPDIRHAFDRVA
jgi:homoserine kinase type II